MCPVSSIHSSVYSKLPHNQFLVHMHVIKMMMMIMVMVWVCEEKENAFFSYSANMLSYNDIRIKIKWYIIKIGQQDFSKLLYGCMDWPISICHHINFIYYQTSGNQCSRLMNDHTSFVIPVAILLKLMSTHRYLYYLCVYVWYHCTIIITLRTRCCNFTLNFGVFEWIHKRPN